jgi:ATP-binding cassette, subfamily A (ABC1), member 3
VREHLEIYC